MRENLIKIVLVVIAVAVTTFYFVFDPAQTKFFPGCFFYQLTGKYCFGCGGQRAFHTLLHGNFATAFHDNLLIFIVLPIVGVKFLNELLAKKYLADFLQNRKVLWIFLAILGIFFVVRNLPFEPFTSLVPAK